MLPEFLTLFEHTLRLGVWRASDRVFEFRDGKTRVIFGSGNKPESLESATAKAAWLDEPGQNDFKLQSWEAINRRLALHQGRALLTSTPYNLGWLKQQVYDRWRDGATDIEVIQYESIANPSFPRAEFERMRAELPDWKFQMFLRGLFSRPAGLIYSDFVDAYREEGGHKVRAFDLASEWPRWGGLDFGGVNQARLLIAQDPTRNIYYLYSDNLEGGKTTAEHVAAARVATTGVNLQGWFGGAGSEDQQRRDWTAAGLYVQEPPLSVVPGTGKPGIVEAGIDRVIALFKQRRLFVLDSCARTLDELGSYSRVLNEQYQPTEKIDDKAKYHCLDALRYLVQGLERPVAASAERIVPVGGYSAARRRSI